MGEKYPQQPLREPTLFRVLFAPGLQCLRKILSLNWHITSDFLLTKLGKKINDFRILVPNFPK
jgi:hypothetical protein